ncbi:MAG TPA: ABC transporter permease subunit [Planctomycetota bacterium]|nr:ABC transporter permease subunit [Planctomycetota bacterium]
MSALVALVRRELGTYFVSPTAYIILTAMLLVSGLTFMRYLADFASARVPVDFGPTLGTIVFVVVASSALVTMRLVAEEKSRGTLEIALTAPVTEMQFVLSKYIAALALLGWQLLLTGGLVLVVARHGDVDVGAVLCGYAGVLLVGAVTYAVGLFISSLCTSQVTAGMVTFTLSLLLLAANVLVENRAGGGLQPVLEAVSLMENFSDFLKGVVDTGRLVTLLSICVFFVFLSARVLESRRWR